MVIYAGIRRPQDSPVGLIFRHLPCQKLAKLAEGNAATSTLAEGAAATSTLGWSNGNRCVR